jgi:hypothetical protein
MADTTNAAAGTQLNTNIEPGGFNEKSEAPPSATKGKPLEEEEEDEDMDALIDELESEDGHAEEEEEGEEVTAGVGRVVPEDQLQTDTRTGLTEAEVAVRRKKYGLNQMKEEKENLILKFLGYFVGPIQFVMEVSSRSHFSTFPPPVTCQLSPHPPTNPHLAARPTNNINIGACDLRPIMLCFGFAPSTPSTLHSHLCHYILSMS